MAHLRRMTTMMMMIIIIIIIIPFCILTTEKEYAISVIHRPFKEQTMYLVFTCKVAISAFTGT